MSIEGRAVTSRYTETLGTEMVAGRPIGAEDRDESAPVAVVSERLARTLWGEPPSALGQTLDLEIFGAPRSVNVVGVVQDVRTSVRRSAAPTV